MNAFLSFLAEPMVVRGVGFAFAAMLALNVLLHVAVYAMPRALVPFNALPWAFRFGFNLDLEFQTVTYTAVHDKWISRWSHLTMPLEQVAWAILLLSVHPAALGVVLAIVAGQALLLGERPLVGWLLATWAVIAIAAYFLLDSFGGPALVASELLLLAGPFLRFFGHTFEPMPPFIGVPRDAFVPFAEMKLRPTVVFVAFAGIVSEFAAALPHRLIVVQVFWLAQQAGYKPRKSSPWAAARVKGAAIRTQGWKGWEGTRKLFPPDEAPSPSVVADA